MQKLREFFNKWFEILFTSAPTYTSIAVIGLLFASCIVVSIFSPVISAVLAGILILYFIAKAIW